MPENEGAEIRVGAAARKKADELGVDPSQLTGTGQDGAVTVRDVDRAAAAGEGSSTAKVVTTARGYNGEVSQEIEGEDVRIATGVKTPVTQTQYDALPKDEEGNLAYPLRDVKEDG